MCAVVSLLLVGAAVGQRSGRSLDTSGVGSVTIRVVYSDDHAAGAQLLVQLLSGASSSPVANAYTNQAGEVGFAGISIGIYHVVVTGDGIEPSDSGSFEVDARKAAQSQFVSVQRVSSQAQVTGGPPTVPASELSVPKKAQQEFDKAGDCMARRDWNQALQHLTRATEIYPQYVSAYSNLGVVYGQLNDPARQREALEKAVSLNDHFPPALVNLARIDYRDKRLEEAQRLLEKAARVDPTNPQTLTLLAQADLANQDYDAAIANARRVHNLPHDHLAVVHYIAARALQLKNRAQDAFAELETFLKEEPDGPRAARVRDEAAALHVTAR